MEKRKVIKRLLKSMRFIQLAVISSLKSFFALCYSPSHEIHVSICGGEHRDREGWRGNYYAFLRLVKWCTKKELKHPPTQALGEEGRTDTSNNLFGDVFQQLMFEDL